MDRFDSPSDTLQTPSRLQIGFNSFYGHTNMLSYCQDIQEMLTSNLTKSNASYYSMTLDADCH